MAFLVGLHLFLLKVGSQLPFGGEKLHVAALGACIGFQIAVGIHPADIGDREQFFTSADTALHDIEISRLCRHNYIVEASRR